MEALRSGEAHIVFNDYLKQISYNQHYPEAHPELGKGGGITDAFGIASSGQRADRIASGRQSGYTQAAGKKRRCGCAL